MAIDLGGVVSKMNASNTMPQEVASEVERVATDDNADASVEKNATDLDILGTAIDIQQELINANANAINELKATLQQMEQVIQQAVSGGQEVAPVEVAGEVATEEV